MEINKDYYIICDSVDEGLFSDEKVITIGKNPEEIYVHNSCLRKTRCGSFDVTKFHLESVFNGIAKGIVYHSCSGANFYRELPLDSLCLESEVMRR